MDTVPQVSFMTSYFYQIRHFSKNMIPVSICIWDPKWYKGIHYSGLVPKVYDPESHCENCIKVNGQEYHDFHCDYLNAYRRQLSRLNVKRTLDDVARIVRKYAYENDVNGPLIAVFVGYEVTAKRCSERFVLSEWIENELGTGSCPEWVPK